MNNRRRHGTWLYFNSKAKRESYPVYQNLFPICVAKRIEHLQISLRHLLAVPSPVQVGGRIVRNLMVAIMPLKTVHGAETGRR